MISQLTITDKDQSEESNKTRVVEENGKVNQVYDNPTFENGANNNKEGHTNGPKEEEEEPVYDNAEVKLGTESEGMTKLDIDESKTGYESPSTKSNAMYGKYRFFATRNYIPWYRKLILIMIVIYREDLSRNYCDMLRHLITGLQFFRGKT